MKFEKSHRVRYEFSQRLQNLVGAELKVRINNNRSTMLHVRWNKDLTHVSLHHMFIQAPQPIQKAIASYIRRDDPVISPAVRAYIDKNVPKLDHSYLVNPTKMYSRGQFYSLKPIYNKLNKLYFDGGLDLKITWFGEPLIKCNSKCTLGLYYDMVKLVKIHRLLDNPQVPLYVLEYVMYHEMCHAVCPAYIDERGRNCIHGKEFKELEKLFIHFDEAREWLKTNWKNFFVSQGVRLNGRSQQMGKHQAQKIKGRCCKRQSILTYF